MYAIIETGGKQYRVSEGDTVNIENIENDGSVLFEHVVMIADGDAVTYGTPYIESAKVSGDVIETVKGKKILVFRQKLRKGFRKLRGHRQQYTAVKISKIQLN